jgi:hypothetical protein
MPINTLSKFEPEILIKYFRKTLKGFQCGIAFAWFFKPLVCLIGYAKSFGDISLGKFFGFPEFPEKYRDGNFGFTAKKRRSGRSGVRHANMQIA